MMYPTKVTFSMPLLLNLEKYRFGHYYKSCGQWYLDVDNLREHQLIARLEADQSDAYDTYKDLEYVTENNQKQ